MTPSDPMDPRRLLAASLTRALTDAEQAALDAWAQGSAEAREEVARTREVWLAMGLAAEDPAVRRHAPQRAPRGAAGALGRAGSPPAVGRPGPGRRRPGRGRGAERLGPGSRPTPRPPKPRRA
ncbi:hypothetical protein ACRAWD_29450 [Caulobacter segnis]